MTETPLTPDRILDAAEEVLRRFGPQKANLVDVARALEVSHGTIYRHFANKAALRDAVAQRWLHRVSMPLAEIAGETGPALARLRRWLDALIAIKHGKARDDPQMFATYHALTQDAREVVSQHIAELVGQVARIVRYGMAGGELRTGNPDEVARAVFQATALFHHPVHATEWSAPDIDAAFENVWRLILNGLAHDRGD